MRFWIVLLAAALCSSPLVAEASAVAAPASTAPATTTAATKSNDRNVVLQLAGYLKDSIVRTVDGTKEMWGNHGRCKDIRAKQKDYRDKLKNQWELQEKGITPQEMKKRLAKVNGGITYDEFIFLSKGKEDRGKLLNMVFLMWGAPKLFPYALMFYPGMLPSAFAPLPNASGAETKLEKLSRQRSHAVINTLLALEKEAKTIPPLAKMNIFGRGKQQRAMTKIDTMAKTASKLMVASKGMGGAQVLLETLDPSLYKKESVTRAEMRLVQVPNAVVLGLMTAINGPTAFQGFMPNFMRRGTVVAHATKLMEADQFLVDEKVDLESLSTARLLEACNDRMIGGTGRSEFELRQDLLEWLQMAVVQPKERMAQTGEHYNEHLARAALMSYYSIAAARDPQCASYLPRIMFQGHLSAPTKDTDTKHRKKR